MPIRGLYRDSHRLSTMILSFPTDSGFLIMLYYTLTHFLNRSYNAEILFFLIAIQSEKLEPRRNNNPRSMLEHFLYM